MNNKNLYLVIGTFFIAFLFLLSSNNSFFTKLEGEINTQSAKIITPVNNFFSKTINIFYDYDSVEKLKKRNLQLNNKNTELEVTNIALQEKISLLESYSKINTDTFAAREIIAANVTFKDPALGRSIIQLNRGLKNGIESGLIVVSQSGSLIGIIDDVYENYSNVIVINDINSVVPVFLQTSKISGALISDGNNIFIDYVDILSNITIGDNVLTSSLGNIVPAGIPIGRIYEVNKSDDLFLTIKIEPFENINNINKVNILKD
jgi:rod shape-determining protein MreC